MTKLLLDFWILIASVIQASVSALFLVDYFTWEQYAYPPHTYWGLILGIFSGIMALVEVWLAGIILPNPVDAPQN